MPDAEIVLIAGALIAAQGAEAGTAAERALADVRRPGMDERAQWWGRVARAIKEIEAGAQRSGASAAALSASRRRGPCGATGRGGGRLT